MYAQAPENSSVLTSSAAAALAAARAWFVRDGLVLLLFLLLALAAIYPVAAQPRTSVIGWHGDNVQYVYITGWMAQAVLLQQSPFVDPRLNYPDDLALASTDIPYSSMLVAAPVTWLLGPVFSYNLLIWLNLWLSGYFAYLWVLHITGQRAGAVVAGLVFLLTPYRIVHSYGHLQLVSTFALPLFFWALDCALRPPAPRWRTWLLLSGATFLVGSSCQYYLIICLLTGIVYALLLVLPRWGYLLRYGWQAAASVGAGAVLSALPYLNNLGSGTFTAYNILDTRIWSADLFNFLLPSRLHPLWGGLVEQIRPEPFWIEKTLYVGSVALLLAGVALFWHVGAQQHQYSHYSRIWVSVALVGSVLALGTDLHINNQPVQSDNPLWLPAYYIGQLPGLAFMRTWSRFGIITILFVALLAGLGAAMLARRFSHWSIAPALCALLLLDLLPGTVETLPLAPRPVDQWLLQQPGDFAVAHLPAGHVNVNYQAMFGSLFHTRHLPAYNHPQHMPPAYRDFAQRAQDFPAASSVAALRQMGLRYVLLERAAFDGQFAPEWGMIEGQVTQSPDMYIVAELDNVVVVAFR